MQLSWNPPTPVKSLFNQLEEGVTTTAAGGEALSDTHTICIGYNIIQGTGLFELDHVATVAKSLLPTKRWQTFKITSDEEGWY
jgi:hypothetical protein